MFEALDMDRVPFAPDPSPDSIFPTAQLQEAQKRLVFTVGAKGIATLTAEPGMGKSTGLRYAANTLTAKGHRVLYTSAASSGAFGVMRSLHYALGRKPPHFQADLSHYFVEACQASEEPLVVMIDEAQLLNENGLQQLRLLTNRDFDTRPPFVLILAGCSELREMLGQPQMTSLRRRILMSYDMQGLTEDEARLYLEHHLARAGARRKLFEPAAVRELFGHSRGNPGAFNKLALTSLIITVSQGKHVVGLEQLRQAVREQETRP